MSKRHHRKKATRSQSPIPNPISPFFTTILPFIENLEKDDHLLLVLPELPPHRGGGQERGSSIGIVLDDYLSNLCNADYVQRMAEYTRQCGSLESYFDFRARNPKWAAAHNPDQLLLNICLSARLVIAYRYGFTLGHAEYLANEDQTASPIPKSIVPLPNPLPLDTLPLFITMMGEESVPHSIGYELNGEITLEKYNPPSNTVSSL